MLSEKEAERGKESSTRRASLEGLQRDVPITRDSSVGIFKQRSLKADRYEDKKVC